MNNRLSDHQEKQTDLPMLTIKGRTTLPIIQGGMGVGISNWRLAGAVAREGGIGTLSAVGLPMTPAYKPLYDEAIRKWKEENNTTRIPREIKNQIFYDVNLVCIKEEVRKARELSGGNGSIYINIMAATNDYDRQVKVVCEAGVDGIVSGAGLPSLSLHEITKDYPETAIIPILSSARGVRIFLKKWMKKGRIPDAIILEDPSRAAGHLGAPDTKQVNNEETKLENSIPETRAVLQELGLDIPIIAAGGATDRADFDRIIILGASGVQMGTRFLATHESGASPEFKESVIRAQEEDIITYTSNAMLPARGLGESGVFETAKHQIVHARKCVENCLIHCAYRDGIGVLPNGESPAQMCILRSLVAATEGNPPEADKISLKFAGTSAVRIKTLKSVKEIINELTHP